ncbi:unnamed protein product [Hymenolepis diminuta]|uniref:Uncharacterized protein n=1 Tax=Hymenolepis diminuta TaxID=6216 RepID=A0A564Z4C1_HYMDI|nr:unnamed protein product [Hymenolepis diminuta]
MASDRPHYRFRQERWISLPDVRKCTYPQLPPTRTVQYFVHCTEFSQRPPIYYNGIEIHFCRKSISIPLLKTPKADEIPPMCVAGWNPF